MIAHIDGRFAHRRGLLVIRPLDLTPLYTTHARPSWFVRGERRKLVETVDRQSNPGHDTLVPKACCITAMVEVAFPMRCNSTRDIPVNRVKTRITTSE